MDIKYRAWDKISKRMIVHEQDFIPLKITNVGVFRLDPSEKENKWILNEDDRFELMASTGIYDTNGIEIFEGDIVSADWGYGESPTIVDMREIFYFDKESRISENIKIIGNKYKEINK